MDLTTEEEILLDDYMRRWRLALMDDAVRMMGQDKEHHKIVVEESNRLVQSIRADKLYDKSVNFNTTSLTLWTNCFMKNMNILLPALFDLGKSFAQQTVQNSMNMVFMMLDVMFLYKKGNEKMSLAEQYRGINMVSESILKWAQANAPGLLTMRGVRKSDCAFLASPWAARMEDEDLFDATMTSVAEIIGNDSALYTLYSLLVLASPPVVAAPNIADNPKLKEIQASLTLLMYRYLATKAGSHKLDLFIPFGSFYGPTSKS